MTGGNDANAEMFERALDLFPGGVNSPVRAFGAVGGTPRVIDHAEGSTMWDVDGRAYIDFISSWGAIMLGHAAPPVVQAVVDAASRGTSYGAPTPGEVELATRIRDAMPSIERIRFTSSGTEACMSAIRLARAFTGRDRIVKFAGCYHGHADALLTRAGSGVATLGLPGSAGVPATATSDTVVVPYNDAQAVVNLFDRLGDSIAGVIVEPVAANMGLIPPADGFLETLRAVTAEHDAVLVFDEVITGFRVAFGGAQELFGIVPDLTVLGKVIGGGLPVGAFGGRADVMALVAPEGPMYQAGTLSGNPVAMAAGAAVLDRLTVPGFYEPLDERAERLAGGLVAAGAGAVSAHQIGSLLTLFFMPSPPRDYQDAAAGDTKAFGRFFGAMLERGVMLPPSSYEAWFLTAAHDDAVIDRVLAAGAEALALALETTTP